MPGILGKRGGDEVGWGRKKVLAQPRFSFGEVYGYDDNCVVKYSRTDY